MLCWLNEKEMSVQELLQRVQCVIAHVDEIMQRDIRPLLAEDIIEQLHRQFALLSGGRGQDGAPIITFPEFSGFGEVPEEDFLNVVTYLTSIPSLDAASIGFIVIMDRRKDKWSSVKMSLSRIAGAFPGNLQLVFVLRPNRFFQRTIADIGIKLHKDDFKMKIVMINSLSELHGYVDKAQLTNELGGSLEYCHSQWIHHRTAVENFAMTVKTTAQHLKGFGTDVADTELPNNVQSTKDLLVAHTEKHTYLKNELTLAVKQGTTLLGCIKEQPAKTESHKMNPDEIENQTTVERLMAQLDETDNAFEQFWCKHHLKLEQCLQLRHFEQDFREIKLALDGLMDSLSRLSDIGNCVSKVENNLEQLNSLTEKAQPTVEKAQLHASHGDQLIQSNHYAVDSIRPKCVELRRVCDDFSNEAQRKTEVMSKTLQIHRGINKITNWCEDGIYLLASQAVDKCQSQDGAESALTETQQFLKTAEDCQLIELKDLNTQYELVLPEDLKTSVLKTLKRLDDVQEMFEKRCVSLKRLSAKQTRPVQSVAPRPESPPKRPSVKNTRTPPSAQQPLIRRALDNSNSNKQQTEVDSNKKKSQRKAAKGNIKIEVMHEVSQGGSSHVVVSNETEENLSNRRTHIMTELIETERIYVEELQSIMEGYFAELDNSEISYLIPPSLENKRDVLFGNLPEIYEFHNRTFLGELESCADMPELVGSCFQKRKEELQVYQKYCQNKPRSEVLWRECGDSPFFQECQKKLDHKLSLDAYLLKPVQRITKYQLMLKEMLKCTKNEGKAELEEALATMLDIVKSVNDAMHQISITGFEGNLSDLGKLLMQGSFNMWTEHKKGHNKVKDLARFKPMQRHLFLYDKMLLFCKKREETEGHEKNPSYSFKHSLKMSAVGITETVKGDSKKFEVWYNGREEVYIIQAPSMDTKNTWVSEIRKVLTGQLEACREASQLHQKITDISGVPMRHMRKMALRQSDSSSPESTIRMSNLSQNMRHKRADTSGSHSSHTADTARKRFTLQGLSKRRSLPAEPATKEAEPPRRFSLTSSLSSSNSSFVARRRKGPLNVSTQNKRHQIKSDPTPLGYEDTLSDALTSVEKQLKLTSSTSGRGMSVMLRSSSQPGWAQRRLASMDTEDFETIPSSIEESSDSSEEGNCNKDVDAGCFQVELIPESPETQDVPLESSNSVPVQDDAGTRL